MTSIAIKLQARGRIFNNDMEAFHARREVAQNLKL
jgi:hypothetical protein